MQAPTQTERRALISQHLGVSRPYSPSASELIDRFQETLADVNDLEPAEQARLLAALIAQASGKLAALHG